MDEDYIEKYGTEMFVYLVVSDDVYEVSTAPELMGISYLTFVMGNILAIVAIIFIISSLYNNKHKNKEVVWIILSIILFIGTIILLYICNDKIISVIKDYDRDIKWSYSLSLKPIISIGSMLFSIILIIILKCIDKDKNRLKESESKEGNNMIENTYWVKIEKYKQLLILKQEELKAKKIKEIQNDYMPINDLSNVELIENNISYYLTKDYNEKLVVYYASYGYKLNSKYATYILGVAYELGIFVPRILSCAKYYFEQVESQELAGLSHLKAVKPDELVFNMDEEFFSFDPVDALIKGLEKISTSVNNLPDLDYMNEGLDLIKKATLSNYAEALYIMGGLYFDVEQGESRLFEKGALIHLESRPYTFTEYMNKAVDLGHEDAISLMAAMHSYKGNNNNKVTGINDDVLCVKYWNKLYELYQYEFIKELGLYVGAPSLIFDFYGIRFHKIYEFIGKKLFDIADSIIKGKFNVAHSSEAIVGIYVAKMLNNGFFYNDDDYNTFLPIIKTTITQLLNKKDYVFAYQIWLIACKFGIFDVKFNDVLNYINVDDFEVKIHKKD